MSDEDVILWGTMMYLAGKLERDNRPIKEASAKETKDAKTIVLRELLPFKRLAKERQKN